MFQQLDEIDGVVHISGQESFEVRAAREVFNLFFNLRIHAESKENETKKSKCIVNEYVYLC